MRIGPRTKWVLIVVAALCFLGLSRIDSSIAPADTVNTCQSENYGSNKNYAGYCLAYVVGRHIFHWTDKHNGFVTALATVVIMFFTWTLANVSGHQFRQNEIIQRAYLSANPLGIARFISGHAFFSCDVGFHNVGSLPAGNVRWVIEREFSGDDARNAFPIDESRFQGSGNVIAPGTEMRRGGRRIDSQEFHREAHTAGRGDAEIWLYVWGEVRYTDGFGQGRFNKFCFRYNMAGTSRDLKNEGIPKESARYHVYGNDAD